jgi:solute carrier family 25 carnitine/acylcarnitine transporter 20/29
MNFDEFRSGCIAGFVRAIVSQPFDTIKTKMQMNPSYYGTSLNCLRMSIQSEGALSLYRGLTFPLIGNGFIVGTHFHTYNNMKDTLPSPVTGALAGAFGSLISGPVEYVRIKMQLVTDLDNHKHYRNSVDCLSTIIRQNGLSGIFRGQIITIIRESIGYSGFFYVYHNFPKRIQVIKEENDYSLSVRESTVFHKMLKGVSCGLALWGTMYPIDVIKTRMQGTRLDKQRMYTLEIVRFILNQHGIRGFYKGFGLTMVRAVPVNIAIVSAVSYFS